MLTAADVLPVGRTHGLGRRAGRQETPGTVQHFMRILHRPGLRHPAESGGKFTFSSVATLLG